MICCLCTPENPCSQTCFALPKPHPRPRETTLRRPLRWWQFIARFKRWWARKRMAWRYRKMGFTVLNPKPAPFINDVVSVQPMTRRTSQIFYWEWDKTDE